MFWATKAKKKKGRRWGGGIKVTDDLTPPLGISPGYLDFKQYVVKYLTPPPRPSNLKRWPFLIFFLSSHHNSFITFNGLLMTLAHCQLTIHTRGHSGSTNFSFSSLFDITHSRSTKFHMFEKFLNTIDSIVSLSFWKKCNVAREIKI